MNIDDSKVKLRKGVEDDKGAENMSIEETNKLRAKIGLAPLEITTNEKAEDGEYIFLSENFFKK